MLLTVAEYASANRDGTYTVVRGGIISWHAPKLPARIAIFLLVDVEAGKLPEGPSSFRVLVVSPSDLTIDEIVGQVEVRDPHLAVRFAIQLAPSLQEYGEVKFRVQVGEHAAEALVKLKAEPLPP
jgi:hypothetical protein